MKSFSNTWYIGHNSDAHRAHSFVFRLSLLSIFTIHNSLQLQFSKKLCASLCVLCAYVLNDPSEDLNDSR